MDDAINEAIKALATAIVAANLDDQSVAEVLGDVIVLAGTGTEYEVWVNDSLSTNREMP